MDRRCLSTPYRRELASEGRRQAAHCELYGLPCESPPRCSHHYQLLYLPSHVKYVSVAWPQETLYISDFSVAEAEYLKERTSGRKVLFWLFRGYSPSSGDTSSPLAPMAGGSRWECEADCSHHGGGGSRAQAGTRSQAVTIMYCMLPSPQTPTSSTRTHLLKAPPLSKTSRPAGDQAFKHSLWGRWACSRDSSIRAHHLSRTRQSFLSLQPAGNEDPILSPGRWFCCSQPSALTHGASFLSFVSAVYL